MTALVADDRFMGMWRCNDPGSTPSQFPSISNASTRPTSSMCTLTTPTLALEMQLRTVLVPTVWR